MKKCFAVVCLAALLPFVASGAASDRVIEIFTDLSRVPRYSGNETRIGDWLMAWAETRGFNPTRDGAGCGNVIFDVPATEGMENKSLLVLQVHQDMVRATKDGVEHDWERDPVIVDKTDGWLHSKNHETSLGADDGIGLATVLAIAEGGMAHGPLRVIVTVEEETTQVGVKGLDPKWTKDATGLINVDWETEGEVAISSACMETCTFTRSVATQDVTGKVLREIAVTGLRGGHSGIDIDKNRENAIIALAKTLTAIGKETEYGLVSLTGGSAKNAIPTFATAVIALPGDKTEIADRAVTAFESALHEAGEMSASVVATDLGGASTAIAAADATQILTLVTSLTNGVISMSAVLPELVQSSSNLGVVDVSTAGARVVTGFRSSFEPECAEVLAENGTLSRANGFSWTHERSSETWTANPDSHLAALAGEVYRGAFEKRLSVVATHAGLECGAFAAMNPALDMISVGPTVQNPHTINERCEVASIDRVWTLLEGLLLKVPAPIDLPMPVITSFKPDFTQGPTSEVPNVSWTILGPFDRVTFSIDETTVYDGDTRCGEGRWRDLCRPGTHRLKLTVGYGDKEVGDSCFYTALLEGDEPAVLPQIDYFYPDYYVGQEGTAPLVHWETKNVTSLEIWVDETCILVSQNAADEFRLSQLKRPGSYVVRMVAHNVVDDTEASFCYRCEASEPPVLASAPLLRSAGSAPVIRTFEPDTYDASNWETPNIHWDLGGEVDSLELTIDNIPVFMGDGKRGSGRWLDVSRLNDGELRTSHDVSLSVSNSLGVVTSNFTCTCHWDEPPPPPLGSEENPWPIGETVQAYTNGAGGLLIIGSGATSNFTGAASLPWADAVGTIESVEIHDTVTVIGDNLWAGLGTTSPSTANPSPRAGRSRRASPSKRLRVRFRPPRLSASTSSAARRILMSASIRVTPLRTRTGRSRRTASSRYPRRGGRASSTSCRDRLERSRGREIGSLPVKTGHERGSFLCPSKPVNTETRSAGHGKMIAKRRTSYSPSISRQAVLELGAWSF